MKTILFEFLWNNIGSWNGKTAGQEKKYYIKRTVSKAQDPEDKLDDEYFIYDFGDGWTAGVKSKKVSAREAGKAMRQSAGFQGYEWMVSEILKYGRILTRDERHAVEAAEKAECERENEKRAEKREAYEREYRRYKILYKGGVRCPRCESIGFVTDGADAPIVACQSCGYTIIESQPYSDAEAKELLKRREALYGKTHQ